MRKPILLIVILLMSILSGCGAKATVEDSLWKPYSNGTIGFEYPKEWEKSNQEINMDGIKPEIVIVDPESNTSINLIIQQSPILAPSAEQQITSGEQLMSTMGDMYGMKDFKSFGHELIDISGQKAGVAHHQFTLSQNDVNLKQDQLYVPLGQNTYVLTLSTSPDTYEKFRSTFDHIIKSFTFKK